MSASAQFDFQALIPQVKTVKGKNKDSVFAVLFEDEDIVVSVRPGLMLVNPQNPAFCASLKVRVEKSEPPFPAIARGETWTSFYGRDIMEMTTDSVAVRERAKECFPVILEELAESLRKSGLKVGDLTELQKWLAIVVDEMIPAPVNKTILAESKWLVK